MNSKWNTRIHHRMRIQHHHERIGNYREFWGREWKRRV